jgi:hypothetical protein
MVSVNARWPSCSRRARTSGSGSSTARAPPSTRPISSGGVPGSRATVDVAVDTALLKPRPEHDRLLADVQPVLGGRALYR